jgi:hypothetical protein
MDDAATVEYRHHLKKKMMMDLSQNVCRLKKLFSVSKN